VKQIDILERIRQIRRGKGLSQTVMADHLFMAIKTYQNIENGLTKVDIERLQKIADVLEVPIEDLLGQRSGNHFTDAGKQQYLEQLLVEKERYIARLEADLKFFENLLQQNPLKNKKAESVYL